MQYVGKVGDYVYNQWNSLNPATLSGAIDIIVIEQPDGSLHCSPWHIRFGKFQIIRPSQKKIDLYVNDVKTDLPIKLGDGGEAFFVFETDQISDLSESVLTSPLISPSSSPSSSPRGSPRNSIYQHNKYEPDILDLNIKEDDIEDKIRLSETSLSRSSSPSRASSNGQSPNPTIQSKLAFEKARKITKKLNIPSKIDINGDMVLDMDGYKPNSQKNIADSDELFNKIFFKEINDLSSSNNDESEIILWDQIISKDENGNIRILNKNAENEVTTDEDVILNGEELEKTLLDSNIIGYVPKSDKAYFKTLRLTSEQLKKMNLKYGENSLKFKLSEGNSQVTSNLYLWKSTTPIVISDIDGTITKSDALGHVLNLLGRDWTHPGVANLFSDIHLNGYNIVYVTARSVGQADSTRQYLRGIVQDGGIKLPHGPVILSPDRTMAALRREVILKKPEVFKMSCLRDIRGLYFNDDDDERTPFYAGFGNRITDAISYRSVKIPSHRIFTINPNGEVHMELLELAGYRSSYLHIGELVDQFFPPIKEVSTVSAYWNDNQLNEYINYTQENNRDLNSPGSPRSLVDEEIMLGIKADEKFNDLNYWREPLNLSDLSDLESDDSPQDPKSPGKFSIKSFGSTDSDLTNVSSNNQGKLQDANVVPRSQSLKERPTSGTAFSSPLKNFMMFSGTNKSQETSLEDNNMRYDTSIDTNESDYTDEGQEDYTEDEYVDSDDDYTDEVDYEDEEDDDDDDDDDKDQEVEDGDEGGEILSRDEAENDRMNSVSTYVDNTTQTDDVANEIEETRNNEDVSNPESVPGSTGPESRDQTDIDHEEGFLGHADGDAFEVDEEEDLDYGDSALPTAEDSPSPRTSDGSKLSNDQDLAMDPEDTDTLAQHDGTFIKASELNKLNI